MSADLRIGARGPFSLAAAAAFLAGWPPAAREDADGEGPLRLALGPDGATGPLGVALHQEGAAVVGAARGPGPVAAVAARVARVLCLDGDGEEYARVGDRDPVVAGALARLGGLRPVLFGSPFEAGVWAILSQRTRMTQALATRARLVVAHGVSVDAGGRELVAFPAPGRLTDLAPGRGLTPERTERLRELARAGADGRLDAEHLRALPVDEALAGLRELPGIGPYSAQLVLVRGAGAPDALPSAEPRLAEAVAIAYGLGAPPGPAELERIAAPWRPYRAWVSVLMRAAYGRGVSPAGRPPGASP